jgi:hypothetical protein
MACQKKYLYWLLLSCVVLMALSGCVTTATQGKLNITKNIFQKVKDDDKKKPKDFQYYISKEITLKLANPNEHYAVKSGELVITRRTNPNKLVIIAESLPGIIYPGAAETDDYGYLLKVHFDKKHPDLFVKFHQLRPGDDENYYLLYDDVQNSTIKYGDYDYTVNFEGTDLPYLWIRMKVLDANKPPKVRKASGEKLSSRK